MVQMALGDEILQLEPVALAQGVVHDHQLDLHFFRQDVLDVDAHRLPGHTVSYTHLPDRLTAELVKKQFILKGNEIYQMLITKLTEEEK